ncbi:unnamed protein product, partial [Allacma fusca]
RLQHHMGLSGKRPESTDTDDGQDGNSPPRSPAPSDASDSELSLGTNSPPPPTSSQSSVSPSSHHHHALHAFSQLSSLSPFGPTIPIPVSSLPLNFPVSSATMTPTPAHMTTIPALPPHHIPHHAISPSAIFPTLAS